MKLESRQRVVSQRCFNHGGREAVARCVSCGRSYCRECVAEHGGRMICAACLRRETPAPGARRGRLWPILGRGFGTMLAVFVAWSCFYAAAQVLLELPSPVHEGSMWSDEWPQAEKP